jgi:hypothetical protein
MQNDCNSVPSKNDPSSIIKKLKRLTSGGRSLNAIHLNKNLNQIEKHLMLVLAGLLDFRGLDEECSFGDAKLTIAISQIVIRMSMTDRSCRTHLSNLCDKRYVIKVHNFSPDDKRQLESTFMLTDQIFVEYAEELGLDLDAMSSCGGGTIFQGGGNNIPYYLPNVFNDPDSKPALSGKKENKNKIEDFNTCGSRTEGDGLSLCQTDIEEPDQPAVDTAHDNKEVDDIFPSQDISPKIQFQKKIDQLKADAPSEIPSEGYMVVTGWHRKMVAMFRPNKSVKSFVKDNDIYFITDEILKLYGQKGCVIIDSIYSYMRENGRCGQIAWNVNTVWQLVDAAKEKENL